MLLTTEQEFYKARLICYTSDEDTISLDSINKLVESLNKAFHYEDGEVIKECTIEATCSGLIVNILLSGDPLYVAEVEYEPGVPGDYPDQVWCYEHFDDLLDKIWECPEGWMYDVDDAEFQNEEDIIDHNIH